MLIYKTDIIKLLKKSGYSTTMLSTSGNNYSFGGAQLQKFRNGEMVNMSALDKICRLTGCDLGDLIEYVEDEMYDALRQTDYFEKRGIKAPVRKVRKRRPN